MPILCLKLPGVVKDPNDPEKPFNPETRQSSMAGIQHPLVENGLINFDLDGASHSQTLHCLSPLSTLRPNALHCHCGWGIALPLTIVHLGSPSWLKALSSNNNLT